MPIFCGDIADCEEFTVFGGGYEPLMVNKTIFSADSLPFWYSKELYQLEEVAWTSFSGEVVLVLIVPR